MTSTLEKLYTWLKETSTSRDVAAPHSYMRGWYDCVNDVLRKIEEFGEHTKELFKNIKKEAEEEK